MTQTKQILCLILALLMLTLPLTACGNQPDGPAESDIPSGDVTGEAESSDPVEDALTALRGEVDWQGKNFGMLYVNMFGYPEEVEAVANTGDSTGSGVINDAVWERNTLFEEYGNLHFVLIPIDTDNASGHVQREVQSATGDFQLVTQPTSYTASLATTGVLYSYLDLDMDYETDWWDAGTLDFALDGRVFFMNGPFNIVDDDVTYLMTFSKKLHTEYSLANPYELVRSGDWTMETFLATVKNLSSDNGDGVWDEKDTYALTSSGSWDTFFYGADLRFVNSSRDMETPELAMTASDMERALNLLEWTRTLYHNDNITYQGTEATSIFADNRAFYFMEAASYLRGLNAEMEEEYGVIPAPKYDKNQQHHTAWSHSIGSTLSMPTTVGELDTDAFSRVLELYVVLSQKLVRPAYYDTVLTTRNVRDSDSAEMLHLIFSHRIYDMAMYFNELGLNELFTSSVVATNKFSSGYSRASSTFDKKIARILQTLSKSE